MENNEKKAIMEAAARRLEGIVLRDHSVLEIKYIVLLKNAVNLLRRKWTQGKMAKTEATLTGLEE